MSDPVPQGMYDAASAATLAEVHTIIKEIGVPAVFVPADAVLAQYATRISKSAVDAAAAWSAAQAGA